MTEDFKRKLTAILSADVEGYSRLMGEDEDSTVRTLTSYRNLISSLIERYHGNVVDSPGDNLLAEFESVRGAVQSAVEIQKELQTRNYELPKNRKMQFRIGINLGDVITEGNRIYGDGVNVAARIESLADAGGICLSRSAYDQVKRKIDIQFDYLGEHEVKNIEEPVRVYKVLMDSISDDVLFKEKSNEPASKETKTFSLTEKPSIVVLPFVNMSNDPDQEYFSDGMSEEIINALAKLEGLKVISRTSAFFFKGKDVNLRTIGKELNVEHVLEGSVRKAGNKLRITAQLIKVSDDTHLWSESYNRDLEDVFAIQEEISNAIVDSLKIRLLGKEKESLVKVYTENNDAYEAYIKGRYFYQSFMEGGLEKALYYYRQAIDLDPGYAPAYSAIGEYYYALLFLDLDKKIPKDEIYSKAMEAVNTALEIDNNLPEAYATLGLIKFSYEWDVKSAMRAFETAIRLNPGLSKVHYDFSLHLAITDDMDRCFLEAVKAIELDPLSGIAHMSLGVFFYFTGQYDKAARKFRQVLELAPAFSFALVFLVFTYMKKEMFEEAVDEINKGFKIFPESFLFFGLLGSVYAQKGEKDKTYEILDELIERSKEEYVSPSLMVLLYTDLGEIDKAYAYLEEVYEKRDIFAFIFTYKYRFDPRFEIFFKKIGFQV